ncbi:hypothetical protein CCM_02584 [Cordyceps militaris CM01]|uniref:Uncharacterized protein n=1 Tax=Cordyceps militaris (strain CM01) TaxID=983644 RepID=G3JAJ7_CORMM|nr:uncharacterized protein CCM_02584 [Cordyceps militaris CM01]EGX94313.1 hypothetical protein CCM_02584 [Cordyceps militaris CM01]
MQPDGEGTTRNIGRHALCRPLSSLVMVVCSPVVLKAGGPEASSHAARAGLSGGVDTHLEAVMRYMARSMGKLLIAVGRRCT